MADKTVVDREYMNEFGETRLVMFVLLHLNKTKYPGSHVIKSEKKKFIKRKSSSVRKSGFAVSCGDIILNPQVCCHFFFK